MASYASVVAKGTTLGSHSHLPLLPNTQPRAVDERDSLQRQVTFLTNELSLRQEESQMYQRQMYSRQRKLDASSDAVVQMQRRLDSAHDNTTEALKMVEHYKARVKALMSSLLAAEEKNVELMKEVIRLGNLADTGSYAQKSTSSKSLPSASFKGSTPSLSQPIPTSTTDGQAERDNYFDSGLKYLADLKRTEAWCASGDAPVRLNRPASIHTPHHSRKSSRGGLDPRSAEFTPRHQQLAITMEAKPLSEMFVRPVTRPVRISPPNSASSPTPKAKQIASQSHVSQAPGIGPAALNAKQDHNLGFTAGQFADQKNIRPQSGDVIDLTDEDSPDANTRKWLDEQMEKQPFAIDTSERTTRKMKVNQLIDFSSTENSPSSPTKDVKNNIRQELVNDIRNFTKSKSRDTTPSRTRIDPVAPALSKGKENDKPNSNSNPPFSLQVQKHVVQSDSATSQGSPTPKASAFSRPTSMATSDLAGSGATPSWGRSLASDLPGFKASTKERMAAFASRWSTPQRGRSRRESVATSRTQSPETSSLARRALPTDRDQSSESNVLSQRDPNIIGKAGPRSTCMNVDSMPEPTPNNYAEERSISDAKRRERTMSSDDLASLFANARKMIESPKNAGGSSTVIRSNALHYEAGTSLSKSSEGEQPRIPKPSVPGMTSAERGQSETNNDKRELGGLLDPLCRALVIKENAWGLKSQHLYDASQQRFRCRIPIGPNARVVAQDICSAIWKRAERHGPGRSGTCYRLVNGSLKISETGLIIKALSRSHGAEVERDKFSFAMPASKVPVLENKNVLADYAASVQAASGTRFRQETPHSIAKGAEASNGIEQAGASEKTEEREEGEVTP